MGWTMVEHKLSMFFVHFPPISLAIFDEFLKFRSAFQNPKTWVSGVPDWFLGYGADAPFYKMCDHEVFIFEEQVP